MRPGPKTIPTAIHIAAGVSPRGGAPTWVGRGRRPPPKDEPKPPEHSINDPMPDPSDDVSDAAREYWYGWIGQRVRALKVLTNADLAALELLCETWADYVEARDRVRLEGAYSEDLTKILAPAKRLDNLARMVYAQLQGFGMTPSSRTGVKTVAGALGSGDGAANETGSGVDGKKAKGAKPVVGPKRFFGTRSS